MRLTRAPWGLLLAGLAAGCATTQAGTVPAGPPLAVPDPPVREVAPLEAGSESPGPAAADVDTIEDPASAEVPPAVAPEPPAAARVPETPAAAAAPDPVPVRDLRAGSADSQGEATVRAELRRAARDLARVDYNALSGAGRLQYEQSRRFSQQAEAALADGNVVFAATLAEKAADLAVGLAGN